MKYLNIIVSDVFLRLLELFEIFDDRLKNVI